MSAIGKVLWAFVEATGTFAFWVARVKPDVLHHHQPGRIAVAAVLHWCIMALPTAAGAGYLIRWIGGEA